MTCSIPRRLTLSLGLFLLVVGLLFLNLAVTRSAHAASYTAGTFTELVNRINDANGSGEDDTITLTANIVLTDTLPAISSNITIEGNGHTIDGNNNFYIFDIESNCFFPVVSLNNMTLANGLAENESSDGAAIYALYSEVNVNNVTFLHNISRSANNNSYGGAIYNEGGPLTINNSTFRNNQSNTTKGNISGLGGAIYNLFASLSINNSTFSNNQASTSAIGQSEPGSFGGAIYNDFGGKNLARAEPKHNIVKSCILSNPGTAKPNLQASAPMTITNSTFASNQAITSGPDGFFNESEGGAIFNGANLTIVNSTFSGNSANTSGGATGNVSDGGAIYNSAVLSITNSTFSNNDAVASGNGAVKRGRNLGNGGGGITTLKNTILAIPAGKVSNCNLDLSIDQGGNLQFPDTSCGATIPVADPLLDPAGLQDNGGPTQTIALLAGSPAIDTADPAACPATDQRGFARNGICDKGAYEFYAAVVVKKAPQEPPADLVGQLLETPDRVAANNADNLISYTFTVKNIGQGKASAISLKLPVDPQLLSGFTEFNNPAVWVSGVTTDSMMINLPNLSNNEVVSGTIVFRPNTAPVPAVGSNVFSRYSLRWTNPAGDDKTSFSNAIRFVFGPAGSNHDVEGGHVQLMTVDAPVGTKATYHSDFWIPNEAVSAWITSPDNSSVALLQGSADIQGNFVVTVDASGLAPGTYVVAAFGQRSEIYGSGILVVGASGISQAKVATEVGLKALGASALLVPVAK